NRSARSAFSFKELLQPLVLLPFFPQGPYALLKVLPCQRRMKRTNEHTADTLRQQVLLLEPSEPHVNVSRLGTDPQVEGKDHCIHGDSPSIPTITSPSYSAIRHFCLPCPTLRHWRRALPMKGEKEKED